MTSATAHTVGSAVLHPQQTLKGVGTATKSAVVGGSLGYIGWEKLTTDKSVVGIAIHGIYQITRYGDYEVTYAHLSNVFANYGKEVKAGQVIAVSADSLHVEVKYKGEELNALEFLTMIYSNLKVMEQNGKPGAAPQFVTLDMDVHTMYDKDQKEIEDLMMRFFPDYISDMSQGIYALPEHTELALRNIFTMSAMKNYFYETLPSMANPLGMGARSIPIAERVQNLLIGDFLNYLALRHQIFLSSMSAIEKKKHKTGQ